MTKKKFWKYFFDTLKESKWLLLRYLIVGISLVAIGVIANRMHLNNLTYYNSMMTLCYFAEIIGFGFTEGFGIYINQHFSNPDKSKKYAIIGFRWTIMLSLIFVSVLCIVPQFIIKSILGLSFNVSYAFYYIMVFGIFLNALLHYITNLLKKIELFKFQTICSFIQCLLILLGLLILVFSGNLLLILIGIIYLATYFICIIVGLILLNKNKTYPINLLKTEKLKITKQESLVVFSLAFSEVVWNIGYTFLALFILKSNTIVYNQYCYFENALDILNGIFFAFVNVTAIKICRSIGQGDQNEVFEHGSKSLLSSLVIWLFYALVSFICFIPLKHGLNPELKNTALISMTLYICIMLFRFINWNTSTYILGQSEIYAKKSLFVETIAALYWIIMYILAPILNLSIIAIYLIITIELIVKTSIYLIWFFKKKWTTKLF